MLHTLLSLNHSVLANCSLGKQVGNRTNFRHVNETVLIAKAGTRPHALTGHYRCWHKWADTEECWRCRPLSGSQSPQPRLPWTLQVRHSLCSHSTLAVIQLTFSRKANPAATCQFSQVKKKPVSHCFISAHLYFTLTHCFGTSVKESFNIKFWQHHQKSPGNEMTESVLNFLWSLKGLCCKSKSMYLCLPTALERTDGKLKKLWPC